MVFEREHDYQSQWPAIRALASDDVLKEKYYPGDKDFLLDFDEHVRHFEVTEGRALTEV